MSYGFDMGFAQANSLQEALKIALEYTQSQMTKKNIKKTIRDNRYYIPSVRTGYFADEKSKNRKADVLADTADRYWLDALFNFRFLYWEEHKLLGIVMILPESVSEKWPLSIYFQNSSDHDYPLSEWKEGNIPFFVNAAAKAENYTTEEIRAKVDYEIMPLQKPKTIRQKKSAQRLTTKSKMMTSNIFGAASAMMKFSRPSPSIRGFMTMMRMCRLLLSL